MFVIAGGEHKIADKIIEDSEYIDIEIVELNIMESVTSKNIKEGFLDEKYDKNLGRL